MNGVKMDKDRIVYKKKVRGGKYAYKTDDQIFNNKDDAYAYRDSLIANDQLIKQEKELKKLDTKLGLISKYQSKIADETLAPPDPDEIEDERTPQEKQLYKIIKNRLDILYSQVGILPEVQPGDNIDPARVPDEPTESLFYSQSGVDRKKIRDKIAKEVNEVFKGTKVSIKEYLKLTNKDLGTNYKSMNEYIDALTDYEIESSIKPKDKSTEELLKEIE